MTPLSKNVYIDKIYYIVDKYNNTYHRTIKMKPDWYLKKTYIDFDVESKDLKSPKFKVDDNVSDWSGGLFWFQL